jgi:N-acetylglucosaminyldiphosphoundecaprenol N-acetyl-beta-D-mannosaminyltransferase
VGTSISATSYQEALELLREPAADRARVIAVCTVHSVMTARTDPALHAAIAAADLATPDGMPLVWTLRASGNPGQQRVYGPDFMEMALPWGVQHGLRHYFYGATEATLASLRARTAERAPGVEVVGAYAPPFRPLTEEEEAAVLQDIRDSGADVVWVGLGLPKQELWMHRVAPQLPGVVMVGVGAAFDFLAGSVRQAPDWIQGMGLEWLYRLAMEPRRLWRRYAVNNPLFVVLVLRQLWLRRRLRA